MKTKIIEFDVSEIVETKNGVYFKHYKDKKEYPDDGRHSDLCIVCGFPDYPKCREWCRNERLEREKEAKNKSRES
jgi:hypothetical protein